MKIRLIIVVMILGSMIFTVCHAKDMSKDLIVVESSHESMYAQSGLPYIWKSIPYILAEWDSTQQNRAKALSMPFKVIIKNVKESQTFYLFEIGDFQTIPAAWKDRILCRNGREVLIEMDPKEVDAWTDKGYHPIRLFHRDYYYKEKAALVPYTCSYNEVVNDLLSRTNQPQWLDWIEKLSGLESVVIGGTTYTISRRPASAMFSGDVNAKAYEYLLQQGQAYHYGSNLEEDPYTYSGSTWKNLILTIPGQTSPNEIVAYSAHFDDRPSSGIAPGADDDGSGDATILEGARLLRQFRFQRTIKIIFFSGEEDGLVGSAAYVADHPTTNYLGVLHQDMFGYDPDVDRCFEMHIGTLAASADVANCAAATISAYSLNLTYDYLTTEATTSSDHASFWNVGTGAMKIGENHNSAGVPCGPVEDNPYYHTSGDTIANTVMLPGTYDIFRASIASIAAMAIPIQACFSSAPTLTATSGLYKVDLSWTTVSGASSYRVFRSTQGCQGQWFEQTSTTGTTWTDTGVTYGTTYYYYVEAVASDGFCVSNMSNCASAIPTYPHVSYSSNTFTDYCSGGGAGNNNGIIEPGETITPHITILNDGNVNLTGVGGVLSTTTSGISITTNTATFPDINAGASAGCNSPHYVYSVGTGVTCGTVINFNLALSYTQGSNSTPLTHTVGTTSQSTLLNENFSTGNPPAGWTLVDGGSGGGAAATWTTANPGSRNPGTPIVAPFEIVDSDNAGSSATQDEQLITPTLNCSGCSAVTLQFDNQFYVYSTEVADVDVTTNNGTTWTNVLRMTSSDGYPTTNTKTVDITSAVSGNPSNVKIRWHYYNGSYEWWWAIDNAKVTCANPVCNICTPTAGHPGRVLNNLKIVKSGTNLSLTWQFPGSPCDITGYGIYRGTLAWSGYNHASLDCTVTTVPFITSQDTGSYYFLVVPLNSAVEGQYGLSSSGAQIPQGANPCKPQDPST